MFSGKLRPADDSAISSAFDSARNENRTPEGKVGFIDRARASARSIADKVFLQPRRKLARQAGGAMVSGMLLMTVLFHPGAGVTPAHAAAAAPATYTQSQSAPIYHSQVQMSGFTTNAPASQDHGGPTPDISTPAKFIAAVVPAAQDSQRQTHVPAAVTIAQAILESEWGRSTLSTQAQNYFGIKADSGPGPAGVVNMPTQEVLNGQTVTVEAGFRAYHNLYESVMDHGRFLAANPRYANAFKTSDPKLFAQRMAADGYATDPGYTAKVNYLIDHYNLAQYDVN